MPKDQLNVFDFETPMNVTTRNNTLKIREDNKNVTHNTTTDHNVSKKSSPKKKPPTQKKPSPQKKSVSKRAIESDSDDDFSFIDAPSAKRNKQNESTQKDQQSKKMTKPLNNSSISKQLKTAQFSVLKRGSDEPQDDLFAFDVKKAKKDEPKLRRKKNASEPTSLSITKVSLNTRVVNSESNISSDTPMDLEPGRESESTKWLSKESLLNYKKEELDSDTEQQSDVLLDNTEFKSIFKVEPVQLSLNETEVRGKTFKKKINYKRQTTVLKTKDFDIDEANLLYPTAL